MEHNWTLAELRKMTDAEIVAQYDHDTKKYQTAAGRLPLEFYLNELQRRDNQRSNALVIKYTLWITPMTFVMTVATLVNLWPIARDVFPVKQLASGNTTQSSKP